MEEDEDLELRGTACCCGGKLLHHAHRVHRLALSSKPSRPSVPYGFTESIQHTGLWLLTCGSCTGLLLYRVASKYVPRVHVYEYTLPGVPVSGFLSCVLSSVVACWQACWLLSCWSFAARPSGLRRPRVSRGALQYARRSCTALMHICAHGHALLALPHTAQCRGRLGDPRLRSIHGTPVHRGPATYLRATVQYTVLCTVGTP